VTTLQRPFAYTPPLILPAGAALGVIVAGLSIYTARDPTGVLLAVGVAVIVLVCALRVDVALLLLVATAPLEGAFAFGADSQLTIAKLAGALAFGSFFLFALATHRRLLFDRSHAIIVLILALALLSTLQAEDVPQGLSTTVRYASFVGLYVVVSQFVGHHGLQRRIAWVLSLGGTLAGVLMIENFVAERTFQATLTYAQPNDTAFVLATTLPLTFWLLRERFAVRLAAVLMISVMSAGIVLSFSRGALVGLGAAALVHVLTERRHALLILLGALAAVVATFTFVRANPGQIELGLEKKQSIAQSNVQSRLDAWRGAVELVEERPLLGVGPGNFRNHFYDATGNPPGTEKVVVVHNAYLDVAAELGVLAMLLFLAYVGLILWRANDAVGARAGPPGFAAALRSALIVAAVASLFLSEQYYAPLWLLGGLATALWRETRPPPQEP
jgi:putative inorganic carbon (hco3(-)) transporter